MNRINNMCGRDPALVYGQMELCRRKHETRMVLQLLSTTLYCDATIGVRNSASPFDFNHFSPDPTALNMNIEHVESFEFNLSSDFLVLISVRMRSRSCVILPSWIKSKQKTNIRPMPGGVNVPTDIIILINELCTRLSSSTHKTHAIRNRTKTTFPHGKWLQYPLTAAAAAAARQIKNKNNCNHMWYT